MANFVRVATVDEVNTEEGKQIQAAGKDIALFNIDGEYHAVAGTCTHRGGPLGEGVLNGNEVTCPWHGAVFNVITGAALSGPAQQGVLQYPVRVVDGNVEVEL